MRARMKTAEHSVRLSRKGRDGGRQISYHKKIHKTC